MNARPDSRLSLLPLLLVVSLLVILIPWLLGPRGEGVGESNVPPDPYLERVDARRGLEGMAPPDRTSPGLQALFQQLQEATDQPPAQTPFPTVRVWLVVFGPFPSREAGEATRQVLVREGIPAILEPAPPGGGPWRIITGPYTEHAQAQDLMDRVGPLVSIPARVVDLNEVDDL